MHAGLEVILWEDLSEIETKTHKALNALQVIERAIQDCLVGQPSQQDSKRQIDPSPVDVLVLDQWFFTEPGKELVPATIDTPPTAPSPSCG